jgi:hypothetical protein
MLYCVLALRCELSDNTLASIALHWVNAYSPSVEGIGIDSVIFIGSLSWTLVQGYCVKYLCIEWNPRHYLSYYTPVRSIAFASQPYTQNLMHCTTKPIACQTVKPTPYNIGME